MHSLQHHRAVILLGGNLGNREQKLQEATCKIQGISEAILLQSSIYESEAWGFQAPPFLNQVIVIEYRFSAEDLLSKLLGIERNLGRRRIYKKGYISRPIDLDILYFDNLIVESSSLTLPHPRLHLRRFTLAPLVEIMPDFIHPILQQSQHELFEALTDFSEVKLYKSVP